MRMIRFAQVGLWLVVLGLFAVLRSPIFAEESLAPLASIGGPGTDSHAVVDGVKTDIETSNGVIHVIDSAILP